jgi:hypothetical protein
MLIVLALFELGAIPFPVVHSLFVCYHPLLQMW